MAEEFIVDNPVIVPVVVPVAAPAGGEPSPPASLETNYDPATATRSQRVAAIAEMMTGPTAPTVETPAPEPEAAVPEETIPIVPKPRADIPDKFLLPTGEVNVEALVKSYQFAEQKISEQGQASSTELAELRQSVMNLQAALIARGPNSPDVPGAAPEPPAPSEEEVAAANEAWLEKFYENPKAAMAEMQSNLLKEIKDSLEPIVQPITQQREYNTQVANYTAEVAALAGKYSDVDQFRGAMSDILAEGGEKLLNLDNVMEVVYFMAKGKAPVASVAPATPLAPAVSLKDPLYLAQVAADPDVQKAVLGAYKAKTGAEPTPPVVGARATGVTPGMPPTEIRSTKDAARASKEYFKKVFGQTP